MPFVGPDGILLPLHCTHIVTETAQGGLALLPFAYTSINFDPIPTYASGCIYKVRKRLISLVLDIILIAEAQA